MRHIFYFFGFAAIAFELITLKNPAKVLRFVKAFKAKSSSEEKTDIEKTFGFASLFYMIWALSGLFTSEWLAFVALIILSLIPKRYVFIVWLDALFTLIVLLFAILNSYHFHINLFGLLQSA